MANNKISVDIVDGLQTVLDELDQTVVHNTGTETINGIKTFTGNNIYTGFNFCQRDVDSRWISRTTTAQQGTAPSSNQYGGYRFQDKNGVEIGSVYCKYATDGSTLAALYVKSPVAGSTTSSSMGLSYNANGNVSTHCPTPALSSNNANIATTAWFNQKIQVVSALPASPNANVFYFITE